MATASEGAQRRNPNTRARAAALREAERRRESRRRLLLAGGSVLAVVGVLAALVVLRLTMGGIKKTNAASTTAATASVVSKVTAVPASALDAVGSGTATLPTRISGPPLVSGGKPSVVYIGAEYCPYCAAERWRTTRWAASPSSTAATVT